MQVFFFYFCTISKHIQKFVTPTRADVLQILIPTIKKRFGRKKSAIKKHLTLLNPFAVKAAQVIVVSPCCWIRCFQATLWAKVVNCWATTSIPPAGLFHVSAFVLKRKTKRRGYILTARHELGLVREWSVIIKILLKQSGCHADRPSHLLTSQGEMSDIISISSFIFYCWSNGKMFNM